jgi:hypothetical protein
VIRIRRINNSRIPLLRKYEIELAPHGWPDMARRHITGAPNKILEPLLGIGDSWSFIHEADRQWERGNRDWAVEFEEDPNIRKPDG